MSTELDHLRQIALPSRLGAQLGKEIWGVDWEPFPFLLEIEREVVAAVARDTQDWFIVNCPNQVGKTSWAGVLLPFWFIGMFPDKQVIFISYSDAYSMDYGRLVRDLMKEHGRRLFGLTIDAQNDASGDWKLKGHPSGGMLAVGIGGQITGRQGHLVIIDDVLRTMQDAASVATKDTHWKEWQGTVYGRRQPGSTYVVTATRLAEDDLTGRLIAQERTGGGKGLQWTKLVFPGICEPPDDYEGKPEDYVDLLGRTVGDPLECRFTRPTDTAEDNWFTQARDGLSNPQLFDCMVQQNPRRSESGMFPDDRWALSPRSSWPPLYVTARAWDLASKKGAGDYSVGALVGRAANGDIYVDRVFREQMGSRELIEKVQATAAADGFQVPIVVEQERSGAGANLVEFYRRLLKGYLVEPSPAQGTKEQRAMPYSMLQQGGHVHLPSDIEDEEWVREWIKEHAGMMGDGRKPRHDDQIDAASHAVNYLLNNEVVDIVDPNDQDMTMADMLKYDDLMHTLGYS